MRRGFFIAFEGGEGSGKSTQIQRLNRWLRHSKLPTVITHEPGGTQLGLSIRKILLSPQSKNLSSRAELLLYAADRAHHVKSVILPALEAGKVVLCDRYADSTRVYQGICRGLGIKQATELNDFATGKLYPDLTVVMDIPVEEGLRRARRRGALDRLESETKQFHEKVRRGFLKLAKKQPRRYIIFDGRESAQDLALQIQETVKQKLIRRKLWRTTRK